MTSPSIAGARAGSFSSSHYQKIARNTLDPRAHPPEHLQAVWHFGFRFGQFVVIATTSGQPAAFHQRPYIK